MTTLAKMLAFYPLNERSRQNLKKDFAIFPFFFAAA